MMYVVALRGRRHRLDALKIRKYSGAMARCLLEGNYRLTSILVSRVH